MLQRKAFVFILFVLSVTVAYSAIDRNPVESNEVEFITPEKILLKYYEAVERGELVVFDIQMDRSMLIPVHVEYVYLLHSLTPRIKVYAKLKNPMQIPEQGNNMFTAVCAVMDIFGAIVGSEAHIFLK